MGWVPEHYAQLKVLSVVKVRQYTQTCISRMLGSTWVQWFSIWHLWQAVKCKLYSKQQDFFIRCKSRYWIQCHNSVPEVTETLKINNTQPWCLQCRVPWWNGLTEPYCSDLVLLIFPCLFGNRLWWGDAHLCRLEGLQSTPHGPLEDLLHLTFICVHVKVVPTVPVPVLRTRKQEAGL